MKPKRHPFKPAVTNDLLLFIAGIVWAVVGFMLLSLAFSWLSRASNINMYPLVIAGAAGALLIHHFGFLKIADKLHIRLHSLEKLFDYRRDGPDGSRAAPFRHTETLFGRPVYRHWFGADAVEHQVHSSLHPGSKKALGTRGKRETWKPYRWMRILIQAKTLGRRTSHDG
jgi:hypothetical protein